MLYVLIGAHGSGKTHVLTKLAHMGHTVVHYDKHPDWNTRVSKISETTNPDVVIDIPVNVSSSIAKLRDIYPVTVVAIVEDLTTIASRLTRRGGEMTPGNERRVRRTAQLANTLPAAFVGTSDEVTVWLKSQMVSPPREVVIYKATSPSGKVYVGQTVDFAARKLYHKSVTPKFNSAFSSALRKYGYVGFTWEILEVTHSAVQANEREDFWINKLNARDREFGYNIAPGGGSNKGVKHSSDTRKRISQGLKGHTKSSDWVEKIAARKRGVPLTEEHKVKLRRPHTEAAKQRISQQCKKHLLDMNGVIHLSAADAALYFQVHLNTISRWIKAGKLQEISK